MRQVRHGWRQGATSLAATACLLLSAGLAFADSVSVGVFGLFRPAELILQPASGQALTLSAGNESLRLEGSQTARLRWEASFVVGEANGRRFARRAVVIDGGTSGFRLAVPGKIERVFQGRLKVQAGDGFLVAVVTMPRETAVASVVAAENPQEACFEALKAQAVAARSYLLASLAGHGDFDFCDTTHCQFLREPPGGEHPASLAAAATRGLILAHQGTPFAPFYSRSCGGTTLSLAEAGMESQGYPFYSVACPPCRRDPEVWRSGLVAEQVRPLLAHGRSEAVRLRLARQFGWDSVPSNNYHVVRRAGVLELHGRGRGHGVGLCQRGAAALAAEGAGFAALLKHYFPNTTLVSVAP